jgi:hypothetical protein
LARINLNSDVGRVPDVDAASRRASSGFVRSGLGESKALGQVEVEADSEVDEVAHMDVDAQVKQAVAGDGCDSRGSENKGLHGE